MFTALIIIIIIAACLLMLAVLIQNPKGGGLSSTFGGGSTQMFGVKKTTDVLEQATWGLAIAIGLLTIGSYVFVEKNGGADIQSINADAAQSKTVPAAPAPAGAPSPAGTPPPAPAPTK